MDVFHVQTQSSRKAGKWTRRVLSLHSHLGIAAITDSDTAEDTLRDGMRISSAQIWPQYDKKRVKENVFSMDAMLTMHVKGVAAKIRVREKQNSRGSGKIYSYTMKGTGKETLTWTLRFDSHEDLEKAMSLIGCMMTVGENCPVVRYADTPH
ncbi:hypothetical protein, unknown function [Leishmania tarentolae]|uniref:Uncharacterized protein n=1 Tax=Leishmania tarentolae TaxID=5689 RepID=A0A640KP37_LEITA|nr:hypothetical protein, unknown function [Leishmania tarentolae]